MISHVSLIKSLISTKKGLLRPIRDSKVKVWRRPGTVFRSKNKGPVNESQIWENFVFIARQGIWLVINGSVTNQRQGQKMLASDGFKYLTRFVLRIKDISLKIGDEQKKNSHSWRHSDAVRHRPCPTLPSQQLPESTAVSLIPRWVLCPRSTTVDDDPT